MKKVEASQDTCKFYIPDHESFGLTVQVCSQIECSNCSAYTPKDKTEDANKIASSE